MIYELNVRAMIISPPAYIVYWMCLCRYISLRVLFANAVVTVHWEINLINDVNKQIMNAYTCRSDELLLNCRFETKTSHIRAESAMVLVKA